MIRVGKEGRSVTDFSSEDVEIVKYTNEARSYYQARYKGESLMARYMSKIYYKISFKHRKEMQYYIKEHTPFKESKQ
jgi:hypothetical protein